MDHGWVGSWSPGIGDPTFIGWLTTFGYLVALVLCVRAFRRSVAPASGPTTARGGRSGAVRALEGPVVLMMALAGGRRVRTLPPWLRLRALWLGLAIIIALLGINKQLDTQTAVTELGKMLANSEGWYAIRRRVQAAFILGVGLVAVVAFRAAVVLARGELRRMRLTLAGTVFLICFVLIRATTFQHFGKMPGSFALAWLLELGGIALVCVGAHRGADTPARPPRPRAPGGAPPRPR